ncbi:NACHT domain-containing protein [Peribacillus sp. NPDC076916]|uniref:NACHT domain-containing protein n=1 Tax=Peribacillus sp. NPDC076916 TaxID=3390608 RepID=UPI003D077E59
MSFEPGGRADKLGNRYEGRWVIKQFFRLINEEIVSITVEPAGEDEVGVEFWVKHSDGKKEGHQCKARNADKEKWTVSDYKNKKILKKVKYQLDRNPSYIFNIVSAVSNTLLGDICDSARNSSGNSKEFYEYQILTRGESVQKTFKDFCDAMGLDDKNEVDLNIAYNYLKRINIILFPDNEVTKQDLLREASFLFTGKPETVYAHLSNYPLENDKLGSSITSNDLLTYLERQGIFLKQLGRNTIMPVVLRLQEEFKESILPNLINDEVIKRPETNDCIEILNHDGLVIVTGDSGVGKSGVLYQLTSYFDKKDILYVPLRVDRQIPKVSAFHYGNEVGFSDSPVYSIASVSDNKPAVIIIDQLDAIRWTGAHSANALDVCKEIINQVLFLKRQGKQIKLIVSCRSFDLKYDPELKNWFENKLDNQEYTWESIQVKPLSDNILQEVLGEVYSKFNNKQKALLSNPQNLYMWLEINKECDFNFSSSIDLIRAFWSNKRLKIEKEGLSVTDLNDTVDKLTIYMEKNGVISAPIRIVHRSSQIALNALKSHSIVREQNGTLSFSHQSYLDYLIAERVVESIESGKSILEWLGDRSNQTLLRREQLRQAMIMLIQEKFYNFAQLAKDILYSDSIRFHLKHLVLEVIGQSIEYDIKTEELIIELIKDDYWRSHVLETVFIGNSLGIKLLARKGYLREWIMSNNEMEANISVNLLSSIKNSFPNELVELLNELSEGNSVLQDRLLGVIGWDTERDTEEIFNLRIKLAKNKKYHYFSNWNSLGKKCPLRAISYIEAILESIEDLSYFNDENRKNRIENWYENDMKELLLVAEKYPIEVWERLISQLAKYNSQIEREIDESNWRNTYGDYSIIEGTIRLIIKAGRSMAKDDPSEFIKRANYVLENYSEAIKEFVFESISNLSSKYADYGISVFINNAFRIIQIGENRFNIPKRKVAREIIESLSPYCSEDVFGELEELIYCYHEPDELEVARWCLRNRKEGFFSNFYWGEAQYLLLSKLDSKRTSDKVKTLITVLKRRYDGKIDDEIANAKSYGGGIIKSKLDSNLFKISDKSWLNILQNSKVKEDNRKLWTKDESGALVESSIFQFSSSLERVAKTNPERFGILSLQLSSDVSPSYIAAIIRALALKEYDSDIELYHEWQPASKGTIINVLEKHLNVKSREISLAFCRLVKSRDDINWPENIINILKFLSTSHPDPEKETMNLSRTDWDGSMETLSSTELFDNSINCVRGVAVEAIGHLLWRDPKLLNLFEDTIENIIRDPHPSVRISLVETLIPIINIDTQKAVNWYVKNCIEDLRVVEERYSINFMNYTIKEHYDKLGLVLERMICSEREEVVIFGSRMVTAYHIIYNIFEEKVNKCINGSLNQRRGVIKAAGEMISNEDFSNKCIKILDGFLENYEAELKEEMDKVFRFDFNKLKHLEDFIKKYIKSLYFTDSSNLIYILLDYEDDLMEFSDIILSLSDEISEHWMDKTRDFNNRLRLVSTELPKLLIRLYNDTVRINNKGMLNTCLDIWDNFFEKRVGTVRELTEAINN